MIPSLFTIRNDKSSVAKPLTLHDALPICCEVVTPSRSGTIETSYAVDESGICNATLIADVRRIGCGESRVTRPRTNTTRRQRRTTDTVCGHTTTGTSDTVNEPRTSNTAMVHY